jgi:hypothetical protein
MKNVNLTGLKRTHGDDAEKVFIKVREMGGFGDVSPDNPGGLDISGLSESKQESILKYLADSEVKAKDSKADKPAK